MHWLTSVVAYSFVVVALVGLGVALLKIFDAILRLAGDERRANR